ncbi:MAG: methyltransferase domain-containing protein [Steroidobacteraceae bacterium]
MSSSIDDWLHSSRGQALRAAEALLLRESLEDCFGWEMLQIGLWGGGRELLAGARTRRQTVISSTLRAGADVQSWLTQLPVASDSVDAVLLPHTLEFETDPYAVLREVDRVLTGEGKLLVLGFHPWSLWGLRAKATRGGWPPQLRRLLSGGGCATGSCCWGMRSRRRGATSTTRPGASPPRRRAACIAAGSIRCRPVPT